MAMELKTRAEIKPASRLRERKIYPRTQNFESKAATDCISMKTKKDPYDAGF
jgi:hypothetical protein